MSGTITHSWQGTVLVITSDSGTSSCDLKGDEGCRGPQGPAGSNTGAVNSVNGKSGTVILDAKDVHALPDTTVIPSIEGLATVDYVNMQIDEAKIVGTDMNLTNYYTKAAVDNKLNDYATLTYVSDGARELEVAINNRYTKTDVDTKLNTYATKSYVDNAVSNADVDLSNYYTKTEVNSLGVSTFSNDAGYQTAANVRALITEELGVIENGTY